MKINYLLGLLLILFVVLMPSCSDENSNESSTKRLTRIDELNGDGDYKLFSYNLDGKLSSIEDGDEDGMHEKIILTYDGLLISKAQIFDPKLYTTLSMKYKEDTVFILGEDEFRGKINDTLIINTSSNIILKLLGNRAVAYNYDNSGNITSTLYRPESLSYDINPSFYSTIGTPFWFLNYLHEVTDFMDNYAGANNILGSSYNGSINTQYSYEYGVDRYPIKIFSTEEYETIEYKLTY